MKKILLTKREKNLLKYLINKKEIEELKSENIKISNELNEVRIKRNDFQKEKEEL